MYIRKELEKGRILKMFGLLLGLIFLCATPREASAAMQKTNVDGSGIIIEGIYGETYTPKDFQEDVVILFFGRTGCGNTRDMIRQTQESMLCYPSVKPVLMLIDTTDDGKENFAKKNPDVLVAHNGTGYSSFMWNFLRETGIYKSGTIYLPATFVMGKDRRILYASTGLEKEGLKEAISELTPGSHQYETVLETEPTCTTEGKSVQICQNCGQEKPDSAVKVPATGHIPGDEATCTEPQVCTVCETVLRNALGHDYAITVVEPTTSAAGYTLHVCRRCHDSYKSEYVPEIPDSSDEKITVKKASISSLENKNGGKILVTIKKVRNTKGYQIVYGTNGKLNKGVKKLITKEPSATLKNLKQNKIYYIKVRAYKVNSKGKRVYGEYSAVKSVKVEK